MRRAMRIGLVVGLVELVAVVGIVLGPPIVRVLAVAAVVLGIGVNIAVFFWGVRSDRDAVARIAGMHPDSVVRATSITSLDGVAAGERARVVAVVADRSGLSFRDRDDREVLNVAADSILTLELAPLVNRAPSRPMLVTRIDGPVVGFLAGATADQQVDAVVAVRTVLGRPVG